MATKPLASATVNAGDSYDPARVDTVHIIRSKARGCVASFYAPSWRPMAFRTLEAAQAKLARHPGFVQWVQA